MIKLLATSETTSSEIFDKSNEHIPISFGLLDKNLVLAGYVDIEAPNSKNPLTLLLTRSDNEESYMIRDLELLWVGEKAEYVSLNNVKETGSVIPVVVVPDNNVSLGTIWTHKISTPSLSVATEGSALQIHLHNIYNTTKAITNGRITFYFEDTTLSGIEIRENKSETIATIKNWPGSILS